MPRPLCPIDEDLARVDGVRVEAIRLLLFLLVAINVVAAMKLVGAILVSAMLVVPGAMALLTARRLVTVQIVSVAVGLAAVLGGMALSYAADLPSGAVIALVLFVGSGGVRAIAYAMRRRGNDRRAWIGRA